MYIMRAGLLAVAVIFTFLSWPASAEQSQEFGNYVVHYNALVTDLLPAETARAYGITRSRNRAILNLTVLKKVMETSGQPVPAQVSATATNLNGQLRNIPVREIRDGNAIYYIGEFGIADQETLDFTAEVHPDGAPQAYTIHFRQNFFTN